MTAPANALAPVKRTRIQAANQRRILAAALDLFSRFGFRGTTIDQIAERAAMSKSNLLYYFRSKDEIYRAVLQQTLDDWLQPLAALDPDGEPLAEIAAYIRRKVELSRTAPEASRLFATEILQGAPEIKAVLAGPLKRLVDDKAAIIRRWSAEGRLAPVDPHHLIFAIWATTQHYADFAVQVQAVLGKRRNGRHDYAAAADAITRLLIEGLRPRP